LESEWRTNVWRCGLSNLGVRDGPAGIRCNYVARLVTPIPVFGLPYQWFVALEQFGVQYMVLGRASMLDYVDQFALYYGSGHFPGPFSPPLLPD
jgi:hypothetical protein